ncbi:MAG TPA: hypothetical protein VK427_20010 [Kofleriaceae bacterium]|nr:hypothetical protein [Kofleriaceae bacterium]
MKSIRSVVAAFGLFAGLAACSGKKEADQMTKYADQMCACKDVACAEKIFPEIEKWTAANEGKEVDKAAADRYNAQLDRTQKCYDKIAAAAPSGDAPTAPAAPATKK